MADRDTYATLPRALPYGRQRSGVSGSLQIVPHADGAALRRAKRAAGQLGAAGGRVALVKPMVASATSRGRATGRGAGLLDDGPVSLSPSWVKYVNGAETAAELEGLRRSVVRGRPYGEFSWVERTAKCLGLQATLRRQGRPFKGSTQDAK
jgi:hypothetical protein